MLGERLPTGHHVNVMRPDAPPVALDEEGIPRWNVVAEARTPEILVALSLKNGRNLRPGGAKAGHLNQNVHDRLRRQSGNGGAAKVLNTTDESCGKTRTEGHRLALERIGPAWIVRLDADILADCSLDALL